MSDTTAQIAAKGCNNTGITEDLAVKLHSQLGRKVLAVVELVSETRSEKRDGKEKVTLSILTIEPAPNTQTEDHLRELARACHYDRRLGERVTREHRDDCLTNQCDGCRPCTAPHCTVCGRGHTNNDYPFTCVACVGRTRRDLDDIEAANADLSREADAGDGS